MVFKDDGEVGNVPSKVYSLNFKPFKATILSTILLTILFTFDVPYAFHSDLSSDWQNALPK